MAKNKRAIKSAVIQPAAQIRMLVPFLLLLFMHIGGLFLLNVKFREATLRFNERQNDELTAVMMGLSDHVVQFSIVSMFAFVVLMIFLWIRYTHRIFGPMVPINRQLTKLINGDYTGEITLRKWDEFRDTADKLNQLTRKLGEK